MKQQLTSLEVQKFQKTIYAYYRAHGRDLPWRHTVNPYYILVSEIMLQQTQVERVLNKYTAFITTFPDFSSLNRAHLQEVLRVWQGLGYNRRALALKKIANIVTEMWDGILPRSPELFETLPGIGHATACSICAFAYNLPVTFIETNIRSVFIHFFFPRSKKVTDKDIFALVECTRDEKNPRKWYYALMDYGNMLKSTGKDPMRRSAHYSRQSPFKGSDRQLRGMVLRMLTKRGKLNKSSLTKSLGVDEERSQKILHQLECEGFIIQNKKSISIVNQ